MGQYYVVDLETSVKNRGDESVGSFKASPFHPENHIVLGGVRQEHAATTTHKMPGTFWSWPHKIPVPEDCDLLIGHNIGFDLLYLIKDSHEWRDWMRTGMIWDTMLAEYLITGQEKKFASLDNCAEKYGGTLKDERIKEYWENGMDTEDIPKVELAKYLIGDIDNTELVFLKQIEIAHEMGLLELIQTQMEARLATVEMEYNGMFFNRDTCNYAVATMEGHLAVLDAAIDVEYRDVFPTAAWGDINPKSNQQLALYLFGGKLKYRGTEPVLDEDGQIKHYKTGPSKGQVKTRKCDKYHEIHGIMAYLVGSCWSTKGKSGIYLSLIHI